ncbi:hypothetical protein CcCBS67573_g10588 [Chytriomyces confervae]|uniref:Reverse transcriptase domain-containing protein n=1 Tax=Chytriomyces confervae TaxID=246404 RepID=A0A507CQ60_9FUNG|nr:hypothetical protein CcCBS67573_g10588 [Chytriomyces confervae]
MEWQTAAQESLLEDGLDNITRRERAGKLRYINKIVKNAARRSRKRLYNAVNDLRVYDPSSEAKRLACQRARSLRTNCALRPDKLPTYAAHFKTTFGSPPKGDDQPSAAALDSTDPRQPLLPLSKNTCTDMIKNETVHTLIEWMPSGKAAGEDGIHGELVKAPKDPESEIIITAYPLALAFRIFTALIATPDEWNVANVALVYKNKGDQHDVANSRPISLTCRIRMVYEGCFRQQLEHRTNSFLDVAQGGFRRNRSTLDQVLTLHEMIAVHPDLHAIYLDIQAAYDCTNRGLLWTELYNNPHDPNSQMTHSILLPLFRCLFDHNVAHLLVSGSKSDTIEVKRGLLQGTLSAPPLFNVSINSLPAKLRDLYQEHCIRVGPHKINSLLFADDTTVFARNVRVLQRMIDTVSDWGKKKGVVWAPHKSVAIGPTRMEIDMNGVRIQQKESTMYVGMTMTAMGVDMGASTAKRIGDAKKTLAWMKGKGFNGFGFRNLHSLYMYPVFIRSQLEYGLAIRPLSTDELQPIQKFQNTCLRILYSVPTSTSIASLHLISSVPTIKTRNLILNASYFYRLHQSNDIRNLTLHTYRQGLERDHRPQTSSLIKATLKNNPHFSSLQRLPILLNPLLTKNQMPTLLPSKSSDHKIASEIIDKWHYKDLLELQTKSTARTAKILPVPATRKLRHPVVMAGPSISRPVSRTITLWILGRICNHQTRRKCGDTLTRQHGVDCSGIGPALQAAFDQQLGPPLDLSTLGATIIDEAIVKLDFKSSDTRKIEAVHTAINKVRLECGGFSEIVDASTATLQQELDAVFSDYKGPRSIRNQATAIISAAFTPTNYQLPHRARGNPSAPVRGRGGRPRGRGGRPRARRGG